MKQLLFVTALALAAAPALAQYTGQGTAKPAASAAAEQADGEIRRIDRSRGTVLDEARRDQEREHGRDDDVVQRRTRRWPSS